MTASDKVHVFCDACGDCVTCYGEDWCYGSEDGEHVVLEEEDVQRAYRLLRYSHGPEKFAHIKTDPRTAAQVKKAFEDAYQHVKEAFA